MSKDYDPPTTPIEPKPSLMSRINWNYAVAVAVVFVLVAAYFYP